MARLREREASPRASEVTHVFEHGGHMGLLLHPGVREEMAEFLRRGGR